LLLKWEENVAIKGLWVREKRSIMVHIGAPRLIKNVVTNHVLVSCKFLGDDGPEVPHLIEKTILIGVQRSESGGNFRRCVHHHEVMLLTFLDERVAIDVERHTVRLDRDALTCKFESLREGSQRAMMLELLRCVEPWDTFTAKLP